MYKVSRSTMVTKEEKVAVKIANLLNDFSLDLNSVGKYMSSAVALIQYRRALEVLESMQYNKEVAEYNEKVGQYDQRLF